MTAEALLTLEVEPMRSSVTEPALLAVIRAARDGDERAFEEIMLASERRVALLAWRILGDAEEVKEATQETFLRVFRHLSRFGQDWSPLSSSGVCSVLICACEADDN